MDHATSRLIHSIRTSSISHLPQRRLSDRTFSSPSQIYVKQHSFHSSNETYIYSPQNQFDLLHISLLAPQDYRRLITNITWGCTDARGRRFVPDLDSTIRLLLASSSPSSPVTPLIDILESYARGPPSDSQQPPIPPLTNKPPLSPHTVHLVFTRILSTSSTQSTNSSILQGQAQLSRLRPLVRLLPLIIPRHSFQSPSTNTTKNTHTDSLNLTDTDTQTSKQQRFVYRWDRPPPPPRPSPRPYTHAPSAPAALVPFVWSPTTVHTLLTTLMSFTITAAYSLCSGPGVAALLQTLGASASPDPPSAAGLTPTQSTANPHRLRSTESHSDITESAELQTDHTHPSSDTPPQGNTTTCPTTNTSFSAEFSDDTDDPNTHDSTSPRGHRPLPTPRPPTRPQEQPSVHATALAALIARTDAWVDAVFFGALGEGPAGGIFTQLRSVVASQSSSFLDTFDHELESPCSRHSTSSHPHSISTVHSTPDTSPIPSLALLEYCVYRISLALRLASTPSGTATNPTFSPATPTDPSDGRGRVAVRNFRLLRMLKTKSQSMFAPGEEAALAATLSHIKQSELSLKRPPSRNQQKREKTNKDASDNPETTHDECYQTQKTNDRNSKSPPPMSILTVCAKYSAQAAAHGFLRRLVIVGTPSAVASRIRAAKRMFERAGGTPCPVTDALVSVCVPSVVVTRGRISQHRALQNAKSAAQEAAMSAARIEYSKALASGLSPTDARARAHKAAHSAALSAGVPAPRDLSSRADSAIGSVVFDRSLFDSESFSNDLILFFSRLKVSSFTLLFPTSTIHTPSSLTPNHSTTSSMTFNIQGFAEARSMFDQDWTRNAVIGRYLEAAATRIFSSFHTNSSQTPPAPHTPCHLTPSPSTSSVTFSKRKTPLTPFKSSTSLDTISPDRLKCMAFNSAFLHTSSPTAATFAAMILASRVVGAWNSMKLWADAATHTLSASLEHINTTLDSIKNTTYQNESAHKNQNIDNNHYKKINTTDTPASRLANNTTSNTPPSATPHYPPPPPGAPPSVLGFIHILHKATASTHLDRTAAPALAHALLPLLLPQSIPPPHLARVVLYAAGASNSFPAEVLFSSSRAAQRLGLTVFPWPLAAVAGFAARRADFAPNTHQSDSHDALTHTHSPKIQLPEHMRAAGRVGGGTAATATSSTKLSSRSPSSSFSASEIHSEYFDERDAPSESLAPADMSQCTHASISSDNVIPPEPIPLSARPSPAFRAVLDWLHASIAAAVSAFRAAHILTAVWFQQEWNEDEKLWKTLKSTFSRSKSSQSQTSSESSSSSSSKSPSSNSDITNSLSSVATSHRDICHVIARIIRTRVTHQSADFALELAQLIRAQTMDFLASLLSASIETLVLLWMPRQACALLSLGAVLGLGGHSAFLPTYLSVLGHCGDLTTQRAIMRAVALEALRPPPPPQPPHHPNPTILASYQHSAPPPPHTAAGVVHRLLSPESEYAHPPTLTDAPTTAPSPTHPLVPALRRPPHTNALPPGGLAGVSDRLSRLSALSPLRHTPLASTSPEILALRLELRAAHAAADPAAAVCEGLAATLRTPIPAHRTHPHTLLEGWALVLWHHVAAPATGGVEPPERRHLSSLVSAFFAMYLPTFLAVPDPDAIARHIASNVKRIGERFGILQSGSNGVGGRTWARTSSVDSSSADDPYDDMLADTPTDELESDLPPTHPARLALPSPSAVAHRAAYLAALGDRSTHNGEILVDGITGQKFRFGTKTKRLNINYAFLERKAFGRQNPASNSIFDPSRMFSTSSSQFRQARRFTFSPRIDRSSRPESRTRPALEQALIHLKDAMMGPTLPSLPDILLQASHADAPSDSSSHTSPTDPSTQSSSLEPSTRLSSLEGIVRKRLDRLVTGAHSYATAALVQSLLAACPSALFALLAAVCAAGRVSDRDSLLHAIGTVAAAASITQISSDTPSCPHISPLHSSPDPPYSFASFDSPSTLDSSSPYPPLCPLSPPHHVHSLFGPSNLWSLQERCANPLTPPGVPIPPRAARELIFSLAANPTREADAAATASGVLASVPDGRQAPLDGFAVWVQTVCSWPTQDVIATLPRPAAAAVVAIALATHDPLADSSILTESYTPDHINRRTNQLTHNNPVRITPTRLETVLSSLERAGILPGTQALHKSILLRLTWSFRPVLVLRWVACMEQRYAIPLRPSTWYSVYRLVAGMIAAQYVHYEDRTPEAAAARALQLGVLLARKALLGSSTVAGPTLADLLSGRTPPSADTVAKALDALNSQSRSVFESGRPPPHTQGHTAKDKDDFDPQDTATAAAPPSPAELSSWLRGQHVLDFAAACPDLFWELPLRRNWTPPKSVVQNVVYCAVHIGRRGIIEMWRKYARDHGLRGFSRAYYRMLATFYLSLGDHDEAEAVIRDGIEIDGHSVGNELQAELRRRQFAALLRSPRITQLARDAGVDWTNPREAAEFTARIRAGQLPGTLSKLQAEAASRTIREDREALCAEKALQCWSPRPERNDSSDVQCVPEALGVTAAGSQSSFRGSPSARSGFLDILSDPSFGAWDDAPDSNNAGNPRVSVDESIGISRSPPDSSPSTTRYFPSTHSTSLPSKQFPNDIHFQPTHNAIDLQTTTESGRSSNIFGPRPIFRPEAANWSNILHPAVATSEKIHEPVQDGSSEWGRHIYSLFDREIPDNPNPRINAQILDNNPPSNPFGTRQSVSLFTE